VAEDLDFDGVLAVLQGWMGRRIAVAASNPRLDGEPLNVVGVLSADLGIEEPYDEHQYDFALDNAGHFDISRARFLGATTEDEKLWIESGTVNDSLLLTIELMH
jgi:hypothetical protein